MLDSKRKKKKKKEFLFVRFIGKQTEN